MVFVIFFLIITNFQMLFGTNVYASGKNIEGKENEEIITTEEVVNTSLIVATTCSYEETESIEITTSVSQGNSNDSEDEEVKEIIEFNVYDTTKEWFIKELKEAEELRLFYSGDIEDFSNYISVQDFYGFLYNAYMYAAITI